MLSCSEKIRHEYCCTVVQIGECFPIEGADRIQRTVVNGMDMVISKDIKPGDIMIYAANETELLPSFLSVNNQYGISDYALNANHNEVQRLIDEDKKDEAKKLCGFFTQQNRVKMLKLKGIYSFGFLFKPESLHNWLPATADIDFSSLVGEDFDTVGGVRFVKAYVPKTLQKPDKPNSDTNEKKQKDFDRLIPENFSFHYDSLQLVRYPEAIQPDDIIDVSTKMHGKSAIFGRVECRIPAPLTFGQKVYNSIVKLFTKKEEYLFPGFYVEQDDIYSSRTVLKNRWCSSKKPLEDTTTTTDEWGYVHKILKSYLRDNLLVYGELLGYQPGTNKFLQKGYDYGCKPGECKFMPYRIVTIDGPDYIEWDVQEVNNWTIAMKEYSPELDELLVTMPILYHGPAKDMYRIKVNDKWNEKFLAKLKSDHKKLGMESLETLCRSKVPREGICIRIEGDKYPRNFKLKSALFSAKESANVDQGIIDEEVLESYE